jgi:hypothetical protein
MGDSKESKFLKFIYSQQIDSYAKFHAQIPDDTTKEKGNFFEQLCKCALLVHPIFYKKFTKVRLFDDIPKNEKSAYGLNDKDTGIDIVAETANQVFAIQCKFKSDRQTRVDFHSIATFTTLLANGITTGKIWAGIVMSPALGIGGNVPKIDKLYSICADFWDSLDKQFFVNCILLLSGKQPVFPYYFCDATTKPFAIVARDEDIFSNILVNSKEFCAKGIARSFRVFVDDVSSTKDGSSTKSGCFLPLVEPDCWICSEKNIQLMEAELEKNLVILDYLFCNIKTNIWAITIVKDEKTKKDTGSLFPNSIDPYYIKGSWKTHMQNKKDEKIREEEIKKEDEKMKKEEVTQDEKTKKDIGSSFPNSIDPYFIKGSWKTHMQNKKDEKIREEEIKKEDEKMKKEEVTQDEKTKDDSIFTKDEDLKERNTKSSSLDEDRRPELHSDDSGFLADLDSDSDSDDSKPTLHFVAKKRGNTKSLDDFEDGQTFYHTVLDDVISCKYDKTNKVLRNKKKTYGSLTGFALDHKKTKDPTQKRANGWLECKCLCDEKYISARQFLKKKNMDNKE